MSTPRNNHAEQHHEFTPLNLRSEPQTFLDAPMGSFKGPNSLHNFASSFTRAQSFATTKIDNDIHKSRSFFARGEHLEDNDSLAEDETFDPELMVPSSYGKRLSVVIHDIASRNEHVSIPHRYGSELGHGGDVFYHDDVVNALNSTYLQRDRLSSGSENEPTGRNIHPRGGSNQFAERMRQPSISSFSTQISRFTTASHFNLHQIEDKNGNTITVLQGQSTAPQTIFNSVNIMIGVGLLALPVGMLKAGWLFGVPFLLLCGLSTCWSATLISRAMDTDQTLMTYSDLGYASYGSLAKFIISIIFSLDLIGAGVSLVVLFSDSIHALLGEQTGFWSITNLKIISFFILTPFTFLPLSILSIFSLLGVMGTISVTFLIITCGFLKSDSPGSLLSPMSINMLPASYTDLLLAIGIILAPFSGHAIFPNLKSDMRHPYKFSGTLKVTFAITLATDTTMGLIGFLMFGALCRGEITNNLLVTGGYPKFIYPLLSVFICLVPLAKTALNAKPIITTLDSIFVSAEKDEDSHLYKMFRRSVYLLNRLGVNVLFVFLAILFPDFDRIVGMLGASVCFLICLIFPSLFYLKLCGYNISKWETLGVQTVIVVSIVLSLLSTMAVIRG